MVFPGGTPKGMKQVLEERELNVSKMKAEDIRENFRVCMILNMRKLKWRPLLLNNRYSVHFLPKFKWVAKSN